MPIAADVYRVLIASPSDVAEKRQVLKNATVDWNDLNTEAMAVAVHPVMWEISSTPSMSGAPQDVLNSQIVDKCEIVAAIFSTRIGTPTENEASGTVEEIRKKVAEGVPVLVYFLTKPVRPTDIDPDQLQALAEFKKWCGSQGIYRECESDSELAQMFVRDITRVMRDITGEQGLKADTPEVAGLIGLLPTPITETALAFERIKGRMRGLVAETQPLFNSALDGFDVDSARRELAGFGRGLSRLGGEFARVASRETADGPIGKRIAVLVAEANTLANRPMYLDGGRSFNNLKEGALRIFDEARDLSGEDWDI